MKQISIIIALALLTTIANAQNIKGSHEVRANDEVKKQQVEYAAVDSTGQGLVWDLKEVVLPKWTLTADYTKQIRVPDFQRGSPFLLPRDNYQRMRNGKRYVSSHSTCFHNSISYYYRSEKTGTQ